MKKILTLLALIGLTVSTRADIGFVNYASSGTWLGLGYASNYCVIPSKSMTGGEPVVTYLNLGAVASGSSSTLTSYITTNFTVCVLTNTTTTNYLTSSNSFVAGDWVIIEHLSLPPRFQCEAGIVSSIVSTNQLVLVQAAVNPVIPGDIIYRCIPQGTIPVANSTTAREISNASGLISGQRGRPMLLTLLTAGAATNTINVEANFWTNP